MGSQSLAGCDVQSPVFSEGVKNSRAQRKSGSSKGTVIYIFIGSGVSGARKLPSVIRRQQREQAKAGDDGAVGKQLWDYGRVTETLHLLPYRRTEHAPRDSALELCTT